MTRNSNLKKAQKPKKYGLSQNNLVKCHFFVMIFLKIVKFEVLKFLSKYIKQPKLFIL